MGAGSTGIMDAPAGFAPESALPAAPAARADSTCYHCGEPCGTPVLTRREKPFCCQGCLLVHELLTESGLGKFYELQRHPGVRIGKSRNQWGFLDAPEIREELLDFTDGVRSRVTFHIPAIHCVACVWLLENLFRLHSAIGASQVNFPRREVSIQFAAERIRLSELVALLASIGYEPRLTFADAAPSATRAGTEARQASKSRQRQWLQVGVAGFAFGNIMLFSLPAYMGMEAASAPGLRMVFGYFSLALALPVLLYSAGDYWRSAWASVRQRVTTLDVPIALGLAALYGQSAFEILSGRGEGYLDSMAGLVFLLLCGRAFQQRTHHRLSFDRDFRSFFPLCVSRRTPAGEEATVIANLAVGDRLVLRSGELIPADARLVTGAATIDYSFVTGESAPVERHAGDYLYAGGRQVGGVIEIEVVKPVSQGYLTSLWNHEALQKDKSGPETLNALTNRYSRRFTPLAVGIAAVAGLFWWVAGDPVRGAKAFASVLIVACPCALALAAPFALGTAQRLLARTQIYLRNVLVLERMAQVDSIVFDKTGTLTVPIPTAEAVFHAIHETGLSRQTADLVRSVCRHSTHPLSQRIASAVDSRGPVLAVAGFEEIPGLGIAGTVAGREVRLGSGAWFRSLGLPPPELHLTAGSVTWVSVDARIAGAFVLRGGLRPETGRMLREAATGCELALLSGDNEREQLQFRSLLGETARLLFNQSPLDKLTFVRERQREGRVVMMVGDGLNDAGALKQSDVGVAVVENTGTFSPASDLILPGSQISNLGRVMALARSATRIVRVSFGISAVYNAVGIGIAACGVLSPLLCAVLMPLSSASVVLFACGATDRAARKAGLLEAVSPARGNLNQSVAS